MNAVWRGSRTVSAMTQRTSATAPGTASTASGIPVIAAHASQGITAPSARSIVTQPRLAMEEAHAHHRGSVRAVAGLRVRGVTSVPCPSTTPQLNARSVHPITIILLLAVALVSVRLRPRAMAGVYVLRRDCVYVKPHPPRATGLVVAAMSAPRSSGRSLRTACRVRLPLINCSRPHVL